VTKNIAASVRQRLLNHARATTQDFQRVLTRFAIERLLYRLSLSEARDTYVLKGAMLFITWPEAAFRPTGDLDLLGAGDPNPDAIGALFAEICAIDAPDDGLIFDPTTLRVEVKREDEKYQGVKLHVTALLDRAKIPVQVDVGFGDSVVPGPKRQRFPSLLEGMPVPEILMYPPETVVAEKFEAMVSLAEANTRIKDFYDIWVIARTFNLDMATLVEAVSTTLRRRETAIPENEPVALSASFAASPERLGLWTGFLRRTPPSLPPPPFGDLVAELRIFLGPVMANLALPEAAQGRWDRDAGRWI
jgi:hypothetical protein